MHVSIADAKPILWRLPDTLHRRRVAAFQSQMRSQSSGDQCSMCLLQCAFMFQSQMRSQSSGDGGCLDKLEKRLQFVVREGDELLSLYQGLFAPAG